MMSCAATPLMWRKMKLSRDDIPSIGLTVVYEPEDPRAAIVDIVLVGGLGSHPVQTWTHNPSKQSGYPLSSSRNASQATGSLKGIFRSNSTRSTLVKKSTSRLRLEQFDQDVERERQHPPHQQPPPKPKTPVPEVYWPLDLLPKACPTTRVLVWGCHSIVMNGKLLRSQNSIFAHSEDLLRELTDFRDETGTKGRPVVFVTQSLGGVIVKEVLRKAETEPQAQIKDLLYSTSAVIFMGSPHRVSAAWSLLDAVKNMAHLTLGVDPKDPNLPSLFGGDGDELEAGRETFLKQWADYNFRVKTFQERRPVDQRYGEARVELRLRREASFFGNARERSETLEGSHLDMCAFRSGDDMEWKLLAEVFQRLVHLELHKLRQLTTKEKECLRALELSSLASKENHPAGSYPGTCLWLYDLPEFQSWHHRKPSGRGKVLWIKGPPGSGKSILLKSLRNRIEKQWVPCGSTFLDVVAEGRDLDTVYFLPSQRRKYTPNPSRIYRALLARLYPHDPKLKKQVLSMYKRNKTFDDARVVDYFIDGYLEQRVDIPVKRTFVFVDATDTCGAEYLQDLLTHLSQLAINSDLSIVVASVEHSDATLSENKVIELRMQNHNGNDVLRYVNLNLVAEWEERNKTVHRVAEKARGVFLWAEIIVNILNSAIEEGAKPELIDYTIEQIPASLEGMYDWLLATLSPKEKRDALVLFQWVLLSSEPLRLNDLRFAVRVTKTWPAETFKPEMALYLDPPTSIRDLRRPQEPAFDSPYQFHRWVRQRSLGLLELRPSVDAASNGPGAEPMGLQRVQVVHESVRSFFLSGRGYRVLAGHEASSQGLFDDVSHYALLNACLTYLNMSDFEPLGNAPIPSPHVPGIPSTPATPGNIPPASVATTAHRLPMQPNPLIPYEESKYWKRAVTDQRHLVMSSYPFLRYTVDNILFHLLSPRAWRYFPPQKQLLEVLCRDRCRLWKRWTALIGASDPVEVMKLSESAVDLSTVTSGASVRLARIFRRLNALVVADTKVEAVVKKKESKRKPISMLARPRGGIDPDNPIGSSPPSAVATGKLGRNLDETLLRISPTPGIAVTTSEPSPILARTPEPFLRISLSSQEDKDTDARSPARHSVEQVLEESIAEPEALGDSLIVPRVPSTPQRPTWDSDSGMPTQDDQPPNGTHDQPQPEPGMETVPTVLPQDPPEPHAVIGTGTGCGVSMGPGVAQKTSREILSSKPKSHRSPKVTPTQSREKLQALVVPVDPNPPPVVELWPGEWLGMSANTETRPKTRHGRKYSVVGHDRESPPKSAPPVSFSMRGGFSTSTDSLPSTTHSLPTGPISGSIDSLVDANTLRRMRSDNHISGMPRGNGLYSPDPLLPAPLIPKRSKERMRHSSVHTSTTAGTTERVFPPMEPDQTVAGPGGGRTKVPRLPRSMPVGAPVRKRQKSVSPLLSRRPQPGYLNLGEQSPSGWSPVRTRDTFGLKPRVDSSAGMRSPESADSDRPFWSPVMVGDGLGKATPISPLTSASEVDVRFSGLIEQKPKLNMGMSPQGFTARTEGRVSSRAHVSTWDV